MNAARGALAGVGATAAATAVGLALWVIAVAWIAHRDPMGAALGYAYVASPPIAERTALAAGEALEVSVALRGRTPCTVGGRDGESAPISGGTLSATVAAPPTVGPHLVEIPITCDGVVRDRFARRVDVAGDGAERIEVLRGHVDAGEIEDELEAVLPELLNQQIRSAMPTIAAQVRERTSGSRVPGWIVSGVELDDDTRIRVRDTSVRLDDRGLRVDMAVDADLQFNILNRPVVRPRRRGDRRIPVRIRDRFRPVTARISIRDWPRVRVDHVTLNSTACARMERQAFRPICEQVTDRVYERVEEELESRLNSQLAAAVAAFDLQSFFSGAMVSWAERVDLAGKVEELLAGADLQLARATQDAAGMHFSVTVDRSWLPHDAPARLSLRDGDAPMDVAIASAAINKVSEVVLDRPFSESMAVFRELADAAGSRATLDAMIDRVRNFADAATGAEGGLNAFLKTAALRWNEDLVVTPWVRVGQDGRPIVAVHNVRPFLTEREAEHAAFAISAELPVSIVEGAQVYELVPVLDEMLRALALEVVSTSDDALDERIRMRLTSLARFAQDQFQRITGESERRPLVDREMVAALTTLIPPFARRFSNGRFVVEVSGLRGDAESQSFQMAADISPSEPSEPE